MFFLISNGQDRPTILTENKDQKYHLDFARYCVGQANNELQTRFMEKAQLNKRFYKGDQWVNTEDLDLFFKDDNDQGRNRIKMVKNVIRPMVEQYRGNAIRMGINFKTKSISTQAINRRENKLAEMLHFTNVANDKNNPFGEDMRKKKAVGKSEAETRSIFENAYIDKYVQKINYLLGYVSERTNIDDKQVRIAEELAFSGIGVMNTYEYSGHQQFEVTKSEHFFFDRSAKEYDLSDSEYMGEVIYMNTSEIYEQYPDINDEDRKAIENYAKQYRKSALEGGNSTMPGGNTWQYNNSGKVPVFKVFWRDGDRFEYGFVKDEYGYEYLTRINFVEEGETQAKYTTKDLIKSNSERAKRIFGDKLSKKLYVDTLRTAIFIPQEVMALASSTTTDKKFSDILLDWGVVPYQETENLDFDSVKFPYKCYCWGYVDGEILSPLDDAINPQRFLNRILSVTENQINNSRGSGTVFDESMVKDPGEALRNMNQSKPVLVNAKGRGIQNAVGSYDATIKQGTMVMFQIIDAMGKYIQESTGVNEALKGESTGSDQLVGVTQLLIQRGSLMQEPFYNAITNIFKQCYQSMSSMGKRIYADNERNLAIAVGDEGMETIKITKDMKVEDFRIFVKRENSDDMLIESGNQMLMALFAVMNPDGTRALLDDKRFANLYGRSTPDEIGMALREAAKEREELQRMRSEEENKQKQAQAEEMDKQANEEKATEENTMHEQEARQDIESIDNKKHDIKKEYVKGLAKIASHNPIAQQEIINGAKNLDKQTV